MNRSALLPALALTLAAAPLAAQAGAAPDTLVGRNAVSLEVGGNYVVGLWRQATPGLRIGIEVGALTSRTEGDGLEDEFTDVIVQPSLKLFSPADGAIRPYTMAGVYAAGSTQRAASDIGSEFELTRTEVGGRVGVGLEWSPVTRIALGGHVGVRGGWARRSTDVGEELTADGWTAATFTSGLVATLFF